MRTGGVGVGAAGTGTGAGSGSGLSVDGALSVARGPGTGVLRCKVSGSVVVVFNGTLDSTFFEKIVGLSLLLMTAGGRNVIARLALLLAGLTGCTYW